jgi:hypothetical protein
MSKRKYQYSDEELQYNANDTGPLMSAKFMMWIKKNHPNYFSEYMDRFLDEKPTNKTEKKLFMEYKSTKKEENK